ncbi:hypothetical protein FEM48_Zijuj12G0044000 [Ziziphus jujuba var. spinosa]|uniref:Transcription factor RAX2 n=1 Tax=Ziziphus jujuba var. spinosa TaxID=714518 RepID=A0A978UB58_ZIZJJ|nr:transcription factor RAX2 [Ziziphus jujuba var. spinosa]KAH7512001.1 hypothetical protein FEM48_Zijuj12G0044000 [Ziziphus jujuba var. spinosa]
MGRAPCCDKANVKKGPWSPEEDAKLKEYIEKYGTGGNWIALPQKAGLRRCGKSCRLRWLNYLRPNIKHGEFTDEEDRIICTLFATIGSRWSIIAAQLPGRTDNDIKNYWNTKLKKKLMAMAPPISHQRLKPQYPSLLQSSSSSSSPSDQSYRGSSNYRSSFEPISSFSPSLMSSSCSSAATDQYRHHHHLQIIPQESFISTTTAQMQHYQVKDHNYNLLMFSSTTGDHQQQASCSSSDGSCNNNSNNYFCSSGVEENQNMIQISHGGDYFVNGLTRSSTSQKQNGNINGLVWGGGAGGNNNQAMTTSLEYGLEEIKQLISTSSCSNFLFDENKTDQERVVMYY